MIGAIAVGISLTVGDVDRLLPLPIAAAVVETVLDAQRPTCSFPSPRP